MGWTWVAALDVDAWACQGRHTTPTLHISTPLALANAPRSHSHLPSSPPPPLSTPAQKIADAMMASLRTLRTMSPNIQPVTERELQRAKRTLLTRHESDLKVCPWD